MFGVYEIEGLTSKELGAPANLGFLIKKNKIIKRVVITRKKSEIQKYFITLLMNNGVDDYWLLLGGNEINMFPLKLIECHGICADLSTLDDKQELKQDIKACGINDAYLSLNNIGVHND